MQLRRLFALLVLVTLCFTFARGDDLSATRTWTTVDGRKVLGTFEAATSGVVVIKTPVGQLQRFKVTELTPADQALMAQALQAVQPATNTPTATPTRVLSSAPVCSFCRGYRTMICPLCNGAQFGADKIVKERCKDCFNGRRVVEEYATYNRGAGKRAGTYVADRRLVACTTCDGKGYKEVKQKAYCPQCNGHGNLPCSHCDGTGLATPPQTNKPGRTSVAP